MTDGLAVDWSFGPTLGLGQDGSATMTFEIHGDGETRFLRVMYRHPFSARSAMIVARDIGKHCYREDWSKWTQAGGAQPVRLP